MQRSLRLGRRVLRLPAPSYVGLFTRDPRRTLYVYSMPHVPPRSQVPSPLLFWSVVRGMAGHSKWQNIRHIKAAKDKQRAELSGRFTQRIRIAIKEDGGSDPKRNSQLERIILEAKKADVPNATIENCIKSAANVKLTENYYFDVQCLGPTVLVVEVSTSKFVITKNELSTIFRKNGGKLVKRCSEGMFERKGIIHVTPTEDLDMERALELAIEVDAEDVSIESAEADSSYLKFTCSERDIHAVKKALDNQNHYVTYSECEYIPTTLYPVDPQNMERLERLMTKLYAVPEVVRIFDNVAVLE